MFNCAPPELAPIFSAKDDDLLQTISILTSVLDGHGYESDTGAQGHRGYNEDIMFTWVGAVVDIPFRVHKLLSQLGAKIYFFRLPKVEHDEDHYFNQKNEDFRNKVQAISQALSEYLEWFETNPSITFESEENEVLPKIPLDSTKDEELAHRYIIRLGKLLAPLRAIVPTWETRDTQGSEYAYTMAIVEDPSRAITQLRNLAKGHALCKGRNYIKVEDIPMIIKMVFSTCSIERETIFEILIENNGILKTSQIVEFLNTSKPTALRTMTELKATGLVDMYETKEAINNQNYSTMQIELKKDFKWFLTEEFKKLRKGLLFKPEENNSTTRGGNFLTLLSIDEGDQRKEKTPPSDIKNNEQYSCKVVNVESTNEPCVYIGRSKRYGGPSKWHNPFKIGIDGTRDEVIAKYQARLFANKELMDQISELKGENLGCHCAPLPCHGDLLLRRVNDLFSCYYCIDFTTNDREDYERHVINKHGLKHPCYPVKAQLESLGLVAQGKSWEI